MADLVPTLTQPDQELLEDRWLTVLATVSRVNLLRVEMPSACLEGCRIPSLVTLWQSKHLPRVRVWLPHPVPKTQERRDRPRLRVLAWCV